MKTKTKIFFAVIITAMLLFSGISAFATEAVGEVAETAAQEEANANFFAVIYEEALAHAAEIFSFLTFIGTIVVSYFYKRGLLPSVKTALSTMGSAIGKIKETNDIHKEAMHGETKKMLERLESFEKALTKQSEQLAALEERLISEEDIYRQREKTNLILTSQIDLLGDIFMYSSIPQYQKEITGERINKMKKEIEKYE